MRVVPTFAAALLLIATTAAAQTYPLPGASSAPLVLCTDCPGTSDDKPTYPYSTPLAKHVGRIVDSANTISVQNAGMRTVRARAIRVAPGRNRIYIALGEAVGAYKLDTFFTNKLPQGMASVSTMVTGSSYTGRNPLERVAKPDSFFYAEAKGSGWTTALIDSQKHLNDFDADDRGYLYVATVYFGWGIELDPGLNIGGQLPFVAQVTETGEVSALVSLKSNNRYYVYLSGTQKGTLFDVTNPVFPEYVTNRPGTSNTVLAWTKYEAGSRVAFLNGDKHVRVYTNEAVTLGAAPLADLTASPGKNFTDLSFDDDGNLWLAESGTGVTSNVLWRVTPTGEAYATSQLNVYGLPFAPSHIHASAGYIVLAGRGTDSPTGASATELRLLKMVDGVPQLLDTDNFFRKYYHAAPTGYAQPVQTYMTPKAVRIVAQGGHTYLIYNANGLGDAFELGAAAEPTETLAAPANLYATALGTTVTLNWDAVVGATGYELSRRAADGTWLPLSTSAPPFTDPGRTANTTYAYRVRAVATAFQPSAYTYDVATTASAMALVTPGMTVDALHVSTLRDRVNSLRTTAGLGAFAFSDASGGGASIRASHLQELRTALNEARLALGMTAATFTDPAVSQVRAVHVNEIIGLTE